MHLYGTRENVIVVTIRTYTNGSLRRLNAADGTQVLYILRELNIGITILLLEARYAKRAPYFG